MNYVLVLRQKSSEEGPDDPDNVLVLRQNSSEDRGLFYPSWETTVRTMITFAAKFVWTSG